MIIEKKQLRLEVLKKMNQITPLQRKIWEENLWSQLSTFIKKGNYQNIALYYSFMPEVNVIPMINQLQQLDVHTYLPCLGPDYQLEFAPYVTGDAMKQVYRAVMQPETNQRLLVKDLDLLVVPGIVFSNTNHRIGFGGGYYDRLLEKIPDIPTVSLVFPIQIVDESLWVVEEHDQKIDNLLIAN